MHLYTIVSRYIQFTYIYVFESVFENSIWVPLYLDGLAIEGAEVEVAPRPWCVRGHKGHSPQ